QVLDTSYSLNP
ncbi:unnamed protein product, partial [Allacma fusca]